MNNKSGNLHSTNKEENHFEKPQGVEKQVKERETFLQNKNANLRFKTSR